MWAWPWRSGAVCRNRSLVRRLGHSHTGFHLPKGNGESCTLNDRWIFLCTTNGHMVAVWKGKAWSPPQTPARTVGRYHRTLQAAHLGGPEASVAGRANIPLEKKSRMRLINIPICMCVDMDDNVLECLNTHTHTNADKEFNVSRAVSNKHNVPQLRYFFHGCSVFSSSLSSFLTLKRCTESSVRRNLWWQRTAVFT